MYQFVLDCVLDVCVCMYVCMCVMRHHQYKGRRGSQNVLDRKHVKECDKITPQCQRNCHSVLESQFFTSAGC